MPELSFSLLLQGFGLGAGLIIAIGAQNAFVLRQGIRRIHPFVTALTCTLNDMFLIALGIAGLGTLISQTPILTIAATWGGAAFLLYYGFRSFRSAAKPGTLEVDAENAKKITVRNTILTALAFSLLNPHVYLDTVVILGSIASRYPVNQRLSFGIGAMLASTVWFFGLVYGAGWLAPLFKRPAVWRALDLIIGFVMWTIAASLIWEAIHRA